MLAEDRKTETLPPRRAKSFSPVIRSPLLLPVCLLAALLFLPSGTTLGIILAVVLIVLAVAATWWFSGHRTHSVEDIRTELAKIDDLSGRVPQPSGDGQVARLARTINSTLSRLEGAKTEMDQALERQRRFAADASHELRTPLAGLRANLEEAQLHPDDTDLDELLRRSLRDVDRLQAIIADLLLLASVRADNHKLREETDLSEIVREEVARGAHRVEVRHHLDPFVPVEGIRGQIGRMVTNLLENAERHARHTVEVEVRRSGDAADFFIDDDGAGIAPDDRERVFERFTRLDAARSRDRGGTGLGLAIARDIVLAHDGTIETSASPLGGARFHVRLPLAGPPSRWTRDAADARTP
ncbi:hypothetical protein Ssi03_05870 [Sphaerisporangium siamense]|uniref:histidine kinase n=1 Tax=Sphaerisporangium siamense TaxID=795645 RepID=A0A7W7DDS9_9ACTN|nr:HAMP domain-containing sensor histidine kinase [Sphaerisporangium siamense]MBB4704120.1 signal transduction histidine kinase [Sphaerisporangium siamense]GII82597.1 hypothetical protein Ssi03_05870 [Sphaerisporangium siamense]